MAQQKKSRILPSDTRLGESLEGLGKLRPSSATEEKSLHGLGRLHPESPPIDNQTPLPQTDGNQESSQQTIPEKPPAAEQE